MKLKTKKTLSWCAVIIAVIAIIAFAYHKQQNAPSKLDAFAQCLKDKGAVLYGAFWCPHCIDQKTLFGRSARLLPYAECSTPAANDQTQICKDNHIEGYPTWIFSDASRQSGSLSLETLAQKTGCSLPQ